MYCRIILALCCHGSDKYHRLYSCKNLWDDITNLKNILQHIKNSNARTCTDGSKKDTNYCKGCYNVKGILTSQDFCDNPEL